MKQSESSQPHYNHGTQEINLERTQLLPALGINELRLNMMGRPRERGAEKVVSLDDNALVEHENVTG